MQVTFDEDIDPIVFRREARISRPAMVLLWAALSLLLCTGVNCDDGAESLQTTRCQVTLNYSMPSPYGCPEDDCYLATLQSGVDVCEEKNFLDDLRLFWRGEYQYFPPGYVFWNMILGITVILMVLYQPRFLGWLLSLLLWFFLSSKQSLRIGSMSFALLGGVFTLGNVEFTSENLQLRLLEGQCTFRWRFTHVRQPTPKTGAGPAGTGMNNMGTNTATKAAAASSQHWRDQDQLLLQRLPYRLSLSLTGLECAVYNNSGKVNELEALLRRMLGPLQDRGNETEQRASAATEDCDSTSEFVDEVSKERPFFYRICPVTSVTLSQACFYVGAPVLPTILVASVRRGAVEHFTEDITTSNAEYDRYRVVNQFDLRCVRVVVMPNAGFVEGRGDANLLELKEQLDHEDLINDAKQSVQRFFKSMKQGLQEVGEVIDEDLQRAKGGRGEHGGSFSSIQEEDDNDRGQGVSSSSRGRSIETRGVGSLNLNKSTNVERLGSLVRRRRQRASERRNSTAHSDDSVWSTPDQSIGLGGIKGASGAADPNSGRIHSNSFSQKPSSGNEDVQVAMAGTTRLDRSHSHARRRSVFDWLLRRSDPSAPSDQPTVVPGRRTMDREGQDSANVMDGGSGGYMRYIYARKHKKGPRKLPEPELLSTERLRIDYSWDEPGPVTAEHVEGDFPSPNNTLNVLIGSENSETVITYGPWADLQRGRFMGRFFPFNCQDAEVYTPRVGAPRIADTLELKISFATLAKLRMPYKVRESGMFDGGRGENLGGAASVPHYARGGECASQLALGPGGEAPEINISGSGSLWGELHRHLAALAAAKLAAPNAKDVAAAAKAGAHAAMVATKPLSDEVDSACPSASCTAQAMPPSISGVNLSQPAVTSATQKSSSVPERRRVRGWLVGMNQLEDEAKAVSAFQTSLVDVCAKLRSLRSTGVGAQGVGSGSFNVGAEKDAIALWREYLGRETFIATNLRDSTPDLAAISIELRSLENAVSQLPTPLGFRERLVQFLRQFGDDDELAAVGSLLKFYVGNEASLVTMLQNRYGVDAPILCDLMNLVRDPASRVDGAILANEKMSSAADDSDAVTLDFNPSNAKSGTLFLGTSGNSELKDSSVQPKSHSTVDMEDGGAIESYLQPAAQAHQVSPRLVTRTAHSGPLGSAESAGLACGWIDIDIEGGSVLLYSMPWFSTSAEGCTALLQWKIEKPAVTLSLTQSVVLEAGQSMIRAQMHYPNRWNAHTPRVFLLRQHLGAFADLGADWSSNADSKPEQQTLPWFVPTVYSFKLIFANTDWFFNVNEDNVQPCMPNDLEHNTHLALTVHRLMVKFRVPYEKFQAPDSKISFKLTFEDDADFRKPCTVALMLPKYHPRRQVPTAAGEFSAQHIFMQFRRLHFSGVYNYFNKISPERSRSDTLSLIVRFFDLRTTLYPEAMSSLQSFQRNYFGDTTVVISSDDYKACGGRNLLAHIASRPWCEGEDGQLRRIPVNALEVHVSLGCRNSAFYLPTTLYPSLTPEGMLRNPDTQSLLFRVATIRLELRYLSDRLLATNISISPISAQLPSAFASPLSSGVASFGVGGPVGFGNSGMDDLGWSGLTMRGVSDGLGVWKSDIDAGSNKFGVRNFNVPPTESSRRPPPFVEGFNASETGFVGMEHGGIGVAPNMLPTGQMVVDGFDLTSHTLYGRDPVAITSPVVGYRTATKLRCGRVYFEMNLPQLSAVHDALETFLFFSASLGSSDASNGGMRNPDTSVRVHAAAAAAAAATAEDFAAAATHAASRGDKDYCAAAAKAALAAASTVHRPLTFLKRENKPLSHRIRVRVTLYGCNNLPSFSSRNGSLEAHSWGEIECDGRICRTHLVADSADPEYNCTYSFLLSRGIQPVIIRIYDGAYGRKMLIGEVKFEAHTLSNNLRPFSVFSEVGTETADQTDPNLGARIGSGESGIHGRNIGEWASVEEECPYPLDASGAASCYEDRIHKKSGATRKWVRGRAGIASAGGAHRTAVQDAGARVMLAKPATMISRDRTPRRMAMARIGIECISVPPDVTSQDLQRNALTAEPSAGMSRDQMYAFASIRWQNAYSRNQGLSSFVSIQSSAFPHRPASLLETDEADESVAYNFRTAVPSATIPPTSFSTAAHTVSSISTTTEDGLLGDSHLFEACDKGEIEMIPINQGGSADQVHQQQVAFYNVELARRAALAIKKADMEETLCKDYQNATFDAAVGGLEFWLRSLRGGKGLTQLCVSPAKFRFSTLATRLYHSKLESLGNNGVHIVFRHLLHNNYTNSIANPASLAGRGHSLLRSHHDSARRGQRGMILEETRRGWRGFSTSTPSMHVGAKTSASALPSAGEPRPKKSPSDKAETASTASSPVWAEVARIEFSLHLRMYQRNTELTKGGILEQMSFLRTRDSMRQKREKVEGDVTSGIAPISDESDVGMTRILRARTESSMPWRSRTSTYSRQQGKVNAPSHAMGVDTIPMYVRYRRHHFESESFECSGSRKSTKLEELATHYGHYSHPMELESGDVRARREAVLRDLKRPQADIEPSRRDPDFESQDKFSSSGSLVVLRTPADARIQLSSDSSEDQQLLAAERLSYRRKYTERNDGASTVLPFYTRSLIRVRSRHLINTARNGVGSDHDHDELTEEQCQENCAFSDTEVVQTTPSRFLSGWSKIQQARNVSRAFRGSGEDLRLRRRRRRRKRSRALNSGLDELLVQSSVLQENEGSADEIGSSSDTSGFMSAESERVDSVLEENLGNNSSMRGSISPSNSQGHDELDWNRTSGELPETIETAAFDGDREDNGDFEKARSSVVGRVRRSRRFSAVPLASQSPLQRLREIRRKSVGDGTTSNVAESRALSPNEDHSRGATLRHALSPEAASKDDHILPPKPLYTSLLADNRHLLPDHEALHADDTTDQSHDSEDDTFPVLYTSSKSQPLPMGTSEPRDTLYDLLPHLTHFDMRRAPVPFVSEPHNSFQGSNLGNFHRNYLPHSATSGVGISPVSFPALIYQRPGTFDLDDEDIRFSVAAAAAEATAAKDEDYFSVGTDDVDKIVPAKGWSSSGDGDVSSQMIHIRAARVVEFFVTPAALVTLEEALMTWHPPAPTIEQMMDYFQTNYLISPKPDHDAFAKLQAPKSRLTFFFSFPSLAATMLHSSSRIPSKLHSVLAERDARPLGGVLGLGPSSSMVFGHGDESSEDHGGFRSLLLPSEKQRLVYALRMSIGKTEMCFSSTNSKPGDADVTATPEKEGRGVQSYPSPANVLAESSHRFVAQDIRIRMVLASPCAVESGRRGRNGIAINHAKLPHSEVGLSSRSRIEAALVFHLTLGHVKLRKHYRRAPAGTSATRSVASIGVVQVDAASDSSRALYSSFLAWERALSDVRRAAVAIRYRRRHQWAVLAGKLLKLALRLDRLDGIAASEQRNVSTQMLKLLSWCRIDDLFSSGGQSVQKTPPGWPLLVRIRRIASVLPDWQDAELEMAAVRTDTLADVKPIPLFVIAGANPSSKASGSPLARMMHLRGSPNGTLISTPGRRHQKSEGSLRREADPDSFRYDSGAWEGGVGNVGSIEKDDLVGVLANELLEGLNNRSLAARVIAEESSGGEIHCIVDNITIRMVAAVLKSGKSASNFKAHIRHTVERGTESSGSMVTMNNDPPFLMTRALCECLVLETGEIATNVFHKTTSSGSNSTQLTIVGSANVLNVEATPSLLTMIRSINDVRFHHKQLNVIRLRARAKATEHHEEASRRFTSNFFFPGKGGELNTSSTSIDAASAAMPTHSVQSWIYQGVSAKDSRRSPTFQSGSIHHEGAFDRDWERTRHMAGPGRGPKGDVVGSLKHFPTGSSVANPAQQGKRRKPAPLYRPTTPRPGSDFLQDNAESFVTEYVNDASSMIPRTRRGEGGMAPLARANSDLTMDGFSHEGTVNSPDHWDYERNFFDRKRDVRADQNVNDVQDRSDLIGHTMTVGRLAAGSHTQSIWPDATIGGGGHTEMSQCPNKSYAVSQLSDHRPRIVYQQPDIRSDEEGHCGIAFSARVRNEGRSIVDNCLRTTESNDTRARGHRRSSTLGALPGLSYREAYDLADPSASKIENEFDERVQDIGARMDGVHRQKLSATDEASRILGSDGALSSNGIVADNLENHVWLQGQQEVAETRHSQHGNRSLEVFVKLRVNSISVLLHDASRGKRSRKDASSTSRRNRRERSEGIERRVCMSLEISGSSISFSRLSPMLECNNEASGTVKMKDFLLAHFDDVTGAIRSTADSDSSKNWQVEGKMREFTTNVISSMGAHQSAAKFEDYAFPKRIHIFAESGNSSSSMPLFKVNNKELEGFFDVWLKAYSNAAVHPDAFLPSPSHSVFTRTDEDRVGAGAVVVSTEDIYVTATLRLQNARAEIKPMETISITYNVEEMTAAVDRRKDSNMDMLLHWGVSYIIFNKPQSVTEKSAVVFEQRLPQSWWAAIALPVKRRRRQTLYAKRVMERRLSNISLLNANETDVSDTEESDSESVSGVGDTKGERELKVLKRINRIDDKDRKPDVDLSASEISMRVVVSIEKIANSFTPDMMHQLFVLQSSMGDEINILLEAAARFSEEHRWHKKIERLKGSREPSAGIEQEDCNGRSSAETRPSARESAKIVVAKKRARFRYSLHLFLEGVSLTAMTQAPEEIGQNPRGPWATLETGSFHFSLKSCFVHDNVDGNPSEEYMVWFSRVNFQGLRATLSRTPVSENDIFWSSACQPSRDPCARIGEEALEETETEIRVPLDLFKLVTNVYILNEPIEEPKGTNKRHMSDGSVSNKMHSTPFEEMNDAVEGVGGDAVRDQAFTMRVDHTGITMRPGYWEAGLLLYQRYNRAWRHFQNLRRVGGKASSSVENAGISRKQSNAALFRQMDENAMRVWSSVKDHPLGNDLPRRLVLNSVLRKSALRLCIEDTSVCMPFVFQTPAISSSLERDRETAVGALLVNLESIDVTGRSDNLVVQFLPADDDSIEGKISHGRDPSQKSKRSTTIRGRISYRNLVASFIEDGSRILRRTWVGFEHHAEARDSLTLPYMAVSLRATTPVTLLTAKRSTGHHNALIDTPELVGKMRVKVIGTISGPRIKIGASVVWCVVGFQETYSPTLRHFGPNGEDMLFTSKEKYPSSNHAVSTPTERASALTSLDSAEYFSEDDRLPNEGEGRTSPPMEIDITLRLLPGKCEFFGRSEIAQPDGDSTGSGEFWKGGSSRRRVESWRKMRNGARATSSRSFGTVHPDTGDSVDFTGENGPLLFSIALPSTTASVSVCQPVRSSRAITQINANFEVQIESLEVSPMVLVFFQQLMQEILKVSARASDLKSRFGKPRVLIRSPSMLSRSRGSAGVPDLPSSQKMQVVACLRLLPMKLMATCAPISDEVACAMIIPRGLDACWSSGPFPILEVPSLSCLALHIPEVELSVHQRLRRDTKQQRNDVARIQLHSLVANVNQAFGLREDNVAFCTAALRVGGVKAEFDAWKLDKVYALSKAWEMKWEEAAKEMALIDDDVSDCSSRCGAKDLTDRGSGEIAPGSVAMLTNDALTDERLSLFLRFELGSSELHVNLGTLDTNIKVTLGGAAARMVEPGQGQDSRKGDNVYGYLELRDIEAKTVQSAEGQDGRLVGNAKCPGVVIHVTRDYASMPTPEVIHETVATAAEKIVADRGLSEGEIYARSWQRFLLCKSALNRAAVQIESLNVLLGARGIAEGDSLLSLNARTFGLKFQDTIQLERGEILCKIKSVTYAAFVQFKISARTVPFLMELAQSWQDQLQSAKEAADRLLEHSSSQFGGIATPSAPEEPKRVSATSPRSAAEMAAKYALKALGETRIIVADLRLSIANGGLDDTQLMAIAALKNLRMRLVVEKVAVEMKPEAQARSWHTLLLRILYVEFLECEISRSEEGTRARRQQPLLRGRRTGRSQPIFKFPFSSLNMTTTQALMLPPGNKLLSASHEVFLTFTTKFGSDRGPEAINVSTNYRDYRYLLEIATSCTDGLAAPRSFNRPAPTGPQQRFGQSLGGATAPDHVVRDREWERQFKLDYELGDGRPFVLQPHLNIMGEATTIALEWVLSHLKIDKMVLPAHAHRAITDNLEQTLVALSSTSRGLDRLFMLDTRRVANPALMVEEEQRFD